MISLNIPEIKIFMAKLFTEADFDSFLLKELDISTFTNFYMDGGFRSEFFDEDELDLMEEKQVFWKSVKHIAFAMIKGKKVPLSIKIVFALSKEDTKKFLEKFMGQFSDEDIGGLYINIRFEKGEIHIISGSSMNVFSLDRTLELEWDTQVKNFLNQKGIIFEQNT